MSLAKGDRQKGNAKEKDVRISNIIAAKASLSVPAPRDHCACY